MQLAHFRGARPHRLWSLGANARLPARRGRDRGARELRVHAGPPGDPARVPGSAAASRGESLGRRLRRRDLRGGHAGSRLGTMSRSAPERGSGPSRRQRLRAQRHHGERSGDQAKSLHRLPGKVRRRELVRVHRRGLRSPFSPELLPQVRGASLNPRMHTPSVGPDPLDLRIAMPRHAQPGFIRDGTWGVKRAPDRKRRALHQAEIGGTSRPQLALRGTTWHKIDPYM